MAADATTAGSTRTDASRVRVAADRRRAAPRVRHSWATGTPYELGPHRPNDPTDVVRQAEARRARAAAPYLRGALVTDAVVAFVVMVPSLYSLPATRPFTLLGALACSAAWVLALAVNGAYTRRHLGDGPEEFGSVLRTGFAVTATLGLVSYVFQLELPRRDVLLAVPLITVGTALGRYAWRRWLHARRAQGLSMSRTLVVGEPSAVAEMSAHLGREHFHGIQVVGACAPVAAPDATQPDRSQPDRTQVAPHGTKTSQVELLGAIAEVPQVVVDHQIDTVIVVGAQLTGEPLRRLSWALEKTGAELMVAPGLVEVTGTYVSLRPAAGLSLLRVERPVHHSGRLLAKSALDKTLGSALFLAAVPVVLAAALAVRCTSPGPAFFPQQRVGRDGRTFTMWKLRTMVQGSEQAQDSLLDRSDRDGLMFKMRQDPRVTRVGKVLRKYSVDELPQLWNVVRGDMSLVGPRPPLPREYALYHDATHVRLRVKPGLTGLWQVSGRADLPWDESIRLDLRYVDNWSLAMDLQVLWRTVRAVASGSGAY